MPDNDERPGGASVAREAGLREITDARTMRALAHPVRIALLETLVIQGPMTATEVGERIGESPTTCSFHLRQLARYGFVEEAGGGRGRARPWRMTSIGMSITDNTKDPETNLASSALQRLWRQRVLGRYQDWLETRQSYPDAWQRAAMEGQYVFYLTPQEMSELTDELARMLLPRMDRLRDPALRPPGSVPVEMLVFGYPIGMPPADAASADAASADAASADAASADGASAGEAAADEPGAGHAGAEQ
jgi:DNA-binding transcriptional ArsR family regulator